MYIRRLRKAHEEATRRRAVEQAERRARVPNIAAGADDGWGLGSFGIREHQESTWRLQEADRQLRANALLEEDEEDDDEVRPPRPSARGSARTSRRNSVAHRSFRETREAQTQTNLAEDDGEWEDVTDDEGARRRGEHAVACVEAARGREGNENGNERRSRRGRWRGRAGAGGGPCGSGGCRTGPRIRSWLVSIERLLYYARVVFARWARRDKRGRFTRTQDAPKITRQCCSRVHRQRTCTCDHLAIIQHYRLRRVALLTWSCASCRRPCR